MLKRCLRSLAAQTILPGEVIVIWQGDDVLTRDAAAELLPEMPYSSGLIHSEQTGVVCAENVGLFAATGEVLLLLDDDAMAPVEWLARHLAHYADPKVGAVGGPAVNYTQDGSPFPLNLKEPIGKLTWYGRSLGNMYDQPPEWRERPAMRVDHLVGYNMSLRRKAFAWFEERLKCYWQLFEADACLQVKANGYDVVFDPGIVVDHYPTNTAYAGGRDGDMQIKVANAAFNQAFVLAKHSSWNVHLPRLINTIVFGTSSTPGPALFPICVWRFGKPLRELSVLKMCLVAKVSGWRLGYRSRATLRDAN